MKKSFKFISTLLLVAMITLTTACGKKSETESNGSSKKEIKEQKTKGNCKYYECLSSLKLDDSVEEITKTLGIEPTEDGNKYTYDFDDDKKLVVNTLSSGKISTIKIDYNKEDLKNKKVDLSNLKEIKSNLNKGDGVHYDEFVEQVGNVEGTLIELGSWNKYVWVAGDGKSYVTASFGKETEKCMFFSGMTY